MTGPTTGRRVHPKRHAVPRGVREFLTGLSEDPRRVVLALRELVRGTVPDAEETLLWGGLSYHRPAVGGRVKGAVCQVTCKKGSVRLEFIHGVRLADPAALLRGSRRSKRYVEVRTVEEARDSRLAELIREASTVRFPDPV